MKRIYLIFVMSCLFSGYSNAQTLIKQIEHAYCTLDSASYINEVILSYARWSDNLYKETYKTFLDLYISDDDNLKVIQEHNRLDSIYSKNIKQ